MGEDTYAFATGLGGVDVFSVLQRLDLSAFAYGRLEMGASLAAHTGKHPA
jgi:hypothetical protein